MKSRSSGGRLLFLAIFTVLALCAVRLQAAASQGGSTGFMESSSLLQSIATKVVWVLEGAGILAIIGGAAAATAEAVFAAVRRGISRSLYQLYREHVGQAILLGLEFLVAADIIRTVAVAPTFQNVGVLGVIVLIRTFLSFALEVETTGSWPWKTRAHEKDQGT
jgi:uncharacterized membrane protein